MAITINIRYTGKDDSAINFAKEMTRLGIVDEIRKEPGNLRYEYYLPMDDSETVLLIDAWESQEALDIHHALPLMKSIMDLREKYDLHMTVERYIDEQTPDKDAAFIRK